MTICKHVHILNCPPNTMQITFASEEFHEFMKTKMLVMMPLI